MQEPPINTAIKKLITQKTDDLPYPTIVTITRVYNDKHADAETSYGIIPYIRTLAPCRVGTEALLIFLNGNREDMVLLPDLHDLIQED